MNLSTRLCTDPDQQIYLCIKSRLNLRPRLSFRMEKVYCSNGQIKVKNATFTYRGIRRKLRTRQPIQFLLSTTRATSTLPLIVNSFTTIEFCRTGDRYRRTSAGSLDTVLP